MFLELRIRISNINMLLHPCLLHFVYLLLPLAFSSGLNIARPGCPDRCGNLSIPFPFGVGSDCSLGPSCNIICNNSTNPPKAHFQITDNPQLFTSNITQIVEINHSRVRVKYPYMLALACYEMSGRRPRGLMMGASDAIALWATQYTLSDENWLTAVGCDDLVLGIGGDNRSMSGGCLSYCENRDDSGGVGFCPSNGNWYSAGSGCCRTPIPRGTTYLAAQLTDLSRMQGRRKLFPCSYAFIQEKGISNQSEFSYPLYYLNDSTVSLSVNPFTTHSRLVVLDWRIGAENCSQARRNSTTFACGDNTVCEDFEANVGGYHCRCMEGYEGNPYLTPGCQGYEGNPYPTGGCRDIDECRHSTTNPCDSNSFCINDVGSFTCSCRKGYYGDGRKDGTGCIRMPQSKMINVSIGLGSGLGFLLLLAMCFWLHKVLQKRKNTKRREKFFKRNGGLLLQQQTNQGTLGKTKLFLAKELEKATDHFNEIRILGQGGQGTVYKGMLSDGKIVAIKKSKQVDEDQMEQFINEVVILSQINHRNVVKLLGCCLETEVPLLVYEFLPNGTLFDLIHDANSELPISWNMRLKIAADIAGALAYLHSASSIPIYHRDIKSSNILLDEKYIVKVSDFGTSRSVAVDQTHLTTLVKGTFGYLDPEYFQSSQFTEKSDVYSFGVVLIELLTRQRPISLQRTEEERSLATRFLAYMEANSLFTILDSRIWEQGRKEEVMAVARLAQRSLNLKGKMRPTMKEVATELESIRISQMNATVKDAEYEEARVYEANPMMISDINYTWTTSGDSITSSSSDTHPLIFATV